MPSDRTSRRGASRLAATLFAAVVLAVLVAVFVYRGSARRPAAEGGQSVTGETLRVGALPVT